MQIQPRAKRTLLNTATRLLFIPVLVPALACGVIAFNIAARHTEGIRKVREKVFEAGENMASRAAAHAITHLIAVQNASTEIDAPPAVPVKTSEAGYHDASSAQPAPPPPVFSAQAGVAARPTTPWVAKHPRKHREPRNAQAEAAPCACGSDQPRDDLSDRPGHGRYALPYAPSPYELY